jgi:hypothetical protein
VTRWAALGLAAILLAGCEHYVDLTPDSFIQGNAPRAQFLRDNATCQDKAVSRRIAAGGNGDPHGIYNRAYRSCMKTAGYNAAGPTGFDGS